MDYFDYKADPQFDELPGTWDLDLEELIEESTRNERQRLENELESVADQLQQREELHETVIEDLESKLDWYLEQLDTLYKQHRGKHGRRDEVKARIKEFYREIRKEKRSRWLDIQELEQERREITRSLSELEDSDGIMDDLVNL